MRRCVDRRWGWLIVALLLLAYGKPRQSWGESALIQALPAAPKTSVNGLTIRFDSTWVEGRGYRPTTITVRSVSPVLADRTMNCELELSSLGFMHRYVTVAFDIEIPAGQAVVSKVVTIPQHVMQPWVSLEVWEDGVFLEDLSFKNVVSGTSWRGGGWSDMPRILFVSSNKTVPSKGSPPQLPSAAAPSVQLDISGLSFLSSSNTGFPIPDANAFFNTLQVPSFAACQASDLVENWLNYSSLDVIVISLDDVKNLASGQPRVWDALCRWTWAGGSLCVFGVGADWQGLAGLEQSLRLPAIPQATAEANRGWHEPRKEHFSRPLELTVSFDPLASDGAPSATLIEEAGEEGAPVAPERFPFVWNEAMLGRVVAMSSENPFPGEKLDWQWMFNTIGPSRWNWRFRHGLAVSDDNPDFDNFLISDIGLPPIKTYRVLITLFVIAIGPLNYWLLHRIKRLHLLLFTVPAAAMLVSVALIGYAIFADGLATRLRVRSFTQLDQRTHQAACWARLSYYAGLAPSDGLLFSDNTAVLPLEKGNGSTGFGGRSRYLAWTPDQHLTRGWLVSRTPTQYVTVRSYASRRELRVILGEDGQHSTVENRLGARIRYLLLRDSAGRMHFGKDIEQGKSLSLQALETETASGEAIAELQQVLGQHAPELPPDATDESGGWFVNRQMYANSGKAYVSDGLLETSLRRCIDDLQPESYVAIVERPADLETGVENVIETQSLHVIVGRW